MTERELNREAARRLAIIRHAQEVSGNVGGEDRLLDAAQAIEHRAPVLTPIQPRVAVMA